MPDTPDVDVVVIGAGPAGSTVARYAAAAGLRVLLVDKKQELGAPIQCSGAVSAHALSAVGIPEDEEFICQPVYGFIIHDAEGNGTVLDYRELKPEEYLHRPLGFRASRRSEPNFRSGIN